MAKFLVFIALAAAIFVFAQSILIIADAVGPVQTRIRRRLNEIAIGDTTTEGLRRRILGEAASPWLARLLDSAPVRWLDRLVVTSGLGLATERLLLGMLAAFPALLVLFRAFGLAPSLSFVLALSCAFGLPVWIVAVAQQRRMAKMAELLPEAIDIMVRSLRAGHPVATGVRMIAAEMADPVKSEFRVAADILTYGLDLKSAFERMEQRIPLHEFRYMAAAIRIQYETGGNLAEILASLSNVMRERQKLQMKVQALSAEARLSGRILSLVPFFVTAIIVLFNHDYYSEVEKTPALAGLMGVAVLLVAAGIILIRRMVRIAV